MTGLEPLEIPPRSLSVRLFFSILRAGFSPRQVRRMLWHGATLTVQEAGGENRRNARR